MGNSFKKELILVTGATGFVGRHLVAELTREGHSVVAIGSKVAPLLSHEHMKDYEGKRFNHIFHLAAYTRPGDFCETHCGDQWKINQYLNTNMLSWWQGCQPQASLVALGTSVSYAPGLELREENYLVGEPIERYYSYAMSKRMLLAGLRAMKKQYGLRYCYLVPTVVYGPDYHIDGRELHFIYDIIIKIIKGKKLSQSVTLWGDGNQRRDIVHITDVLAALKAAAQSADNEVYNIGSGKDHSIKDFAKMICDIVGYDFAKIQFDQARGIGMPSKILLTQKILESLKFAPRVSIAKGLSETIDWCRSVESKFPDRPS